MKGNGNTITLLITVSLLIWVTLLVLGFLPLKVFLVQSGSMEPSIMTGDVIVTKEMSRYVVNSVVTFRDTTNRVVTHRIIETKTNMTYVTKGDANKDEDRETINVDRIVGEAVWIIPKLGYLINFAKTLPGLVLFIILPALYLVILEIKNIGQELRGGR